MRILILADPNSPHTIRWATSLAEYPIEIAIFGLSAFTPEIYNKYNNIKIETIPVDSKIFGNKNDFIKIKYLKALPALHKLINKYKPDILHSYYATSYGLLGSLSKVHPLIISLWGSDVFEFPKKSFFHKKILSYNLKKADTILSTSVAMAEEAKKYTSKHITITPFGIDTDKFKPIEVKTIFNENDIVIGTIKSLEDAYGIDYLIKAFKLVKDKHPDLPLKLLIVGGGSLETKLKELVFNLGITDDTKFIGKVQHSEVVYYHNMIDVFVANSNFESFGVAVLEASACEKPVVVTNIGGLPEIVNNQETGIIVKPKNPEDTAKAIERLVLNESLRKSMGVSGRENVIRNYNWKDNVQQMLNIYNKTIA